MTTKPSSLSVLLEEGRLVVVSEHRWRILNNFAELVIRGEINPEVWLRTEEIEAATRDRKESDVH